MTTDQTSTPAEAELVRTPVPGFREALGALRDWAIQTRFDAGFTDLPKGCRSGGRALEDLASWIDNVRLSFMLHGEAGTFPPSLLKLRSQALEPGISLPAEDVRDAITQAITHMRMASATALAGDKMVVLAEAPVAAAEPIMTIKMAAELVARAIGTLRDASNEGWVKVGLATELFTSLSPIEPVIGFPPAYVTARATLVIAQAKLASYMQLSSLEPGLRALEAEIATLKPEK